MYIPNWYKVEDTEKIQRIIRENPFATLISTVDGKPFATHLPLLLAPNAGDSIHGHLAAKNPHAQVFGDGQESLAIFSGPHAYISPNSYENLPSVPTWNYVTVHAYGQIEPVDNAKEAIESLRLLVQTFDPNLASTQPESMKTEFWMKQLSGIRAFRLRITRLEAKAKASQNRSEQDRDAVTRILEGSESEMDQAMAREMKSLPKRASD